MARPSISSHRAPPTRARGGQSRQARRAPASATARYAVDPAQAPELLRAIIDSAPFATMVFDDDQTVVLWNAGAERMFGWRADEVVGRHIPQEMIPSRDRASSQARIRRTLDGASVNGDLVIRRTKDGRDVAVEIHAGPLRDQAGRAVGFAGHMVDVTRLREVERDLALVSRIGATLAGAVARMQAADTLETAAQTICDELRRLPSVDFAAVGGFAGSDAIVLAANADPTLPIRAGNRLPQHRSAQLRERAHLGPWSEAWVADPRDGAWGEALTAGGLRAYAFSPIGHAGHVDGGVVIGTRDPGFARTLLEKWASLIDVSTTSSALLAERAHAHRQRLESRTAISEVLAEDAFEPVFQPIVDLGANEIVGHEALTRFASGRRPDTVFAEAHAVGLGRELELATLRAALDAARRLPAGRWLDVNVSPSLLDDPEPLRTLLAGADRPIVLEVTEHAVVDDYDRFRAAVRSLGREMRLAVDDAGAGVANFAHIVDLGPDFVKLDQSLIRNVNAHLGRQALIVGMRYFSRATGCRLVAEGVETAGEAQTLSGLGVEFGQGFFFGEPAPAPG